jgi:hypothetical protein
LTSPSLHAHATLLPRTLPARRSTPQPCALASDAGSALLLQPTCEAIVQMHLVATGSVMGPSFLQGVSASASCGDMLSSAKTLVLYAHAIHGLLVPLAGFLYLEWRLKAAWAREMTGKRLAYGVTSRVQWPQPGQQRGLHSSSTSSSSGSGSSGSGGGSGCDALGRGRMRLGSSLLLLPLLLLGLLWAATVALAPALPDAECSTCQDLGTCQPTLPCSECCVLRLRARMCVDVRAWSPVCFASCRRRLRLGGVQPSTATPRPLSPPCTCSAPCSHRPRSSALLRSGRHVCHAWCLPGDCASGGGLLHLCRARGDVRPGLSSRCVSSPHTAACRIG